MVYGVLAAQSRHFFVLFGTYLSMYYVYKYITMYCFCHTLLITYLSPAIIAALTKMAFEDDGSSAVLATATVHLIPTIQHRSLPSITSITNLSHARRWCW